MHQFLAKVATGIIAGTALAVVLLKLAVDPQFGVLRALHAIGSVALGIAICFRAGFEVFVALDCLDVDGRWVWGLLVVSVAGGLAVGTPESWTEVAGFASMPWLLLGGIGFVIRSYLEDYDN